MTNGGRGHLANDRVINCAFPIAQTNGQIMDLYRGWFSQNGSCGYVLKPKFLREKYSTFNARRKDLMPGE